MPAAADALADGDTLLHGDLMAKNLLWDGSGLVAIDPMPMVGDPCSDIGFWAATTSPDAARELARRCRPRSRARRGVGGGVGDGRGALRAAGARAHAAGVARGRRGAAAARMSYSSLGVRRVINACGIYTDLGGSVLSGAAWAAAVEANATWAAMDELLDASGARIAALCGCEAARVVPGASAGIALALGACVARGDGRRWRRCRRSTRSC